jgi:poly(3-hydroxybutyrate) depolymerase
MMVSRLLPAAVLLAAAVSSAQEENINATSEIRYPCPADRSEQPAIVRRADGDEPRPLLVALHTWSFDYRQNCDNYADFCKKHNWNFIFPNFRGPNQTPDALGSELMVSDIVAAVEYMKKTAKVDPDRIYLIGGSGGGHATLLLAGRHPEIWAAASAWCPISDVAAWHRTCQNSRFKSYAEQIEKACGGDPTTSPDAMREAEKRSPLTYLAAAGELPLDIATGIHDGHRGSVPVSHTLNAYNLLARPEDRFSAAEIEFITANAQVPDGFPTPAADPVYGKTKIHLRRQSNQVRVTVFEGGHSILADIGMAWLAEQAKGQPPVWDAGRAAADRSTELGK